MHLYEFQAKELLSRYDVAVPRGRVADNPADAERIAHRLGFARFAVKAQTHSIGRLAAGLVGFSASPQGVKATTEQLLELWRSQSTDDAAGERLRWVLIEEVIPTTHLLYAAVLLDRAAGELTLLASQSGGEDIEARARAEPHLVVRERLFVDNASAQGDFAGVAARIGLSGEIANKAEALFAGLARLAVELDATIVEINPLAVTADTDLVALDANVSIDDNALFRHPALAALRAAIQIEEGDPNELAADRHQLNYQKLDGDIGVVANGAGLALATLDLIVESGGQPGNFMDIRTTATSLDVAYGLELVLANPRIRAILVNVHGGGMQRCDTIAEGVGVAMRRSDRAVPIVVRLAGNNADFARVRLESYGINFIEGADMLDAARRAVAVASRKAAPLNKGTVNGRS